MSEGDSLVKGGGRGHRVVAADADQVKMIDKEGAKGHLLHLIHMSCSLLLLFTAYNPNLMGANNGAVGLISLATIYVTLCISSILVGPIVVTYLKPKWSLILGSLCYCSFILAYRWPSVYSLISTAALLGIGGSILWNAQGTYLTQCSSNYALKRGEDRKSTMGFFNGIFFAIFQINQIIGNLIAGFILTSSFSEATQILGYVFIAAGGLSTVSLLFLKLEESVAPPKHTNMVEKVFKAVLLLKDRRLLLLLPVIFYSGMEQGFIFGSFTSVIISKTLGASHIGFVMAVFGGFDVLGSFLLGKMADHYHTPPLIIIGFVTQSIFLIFFFFVIFYTEYTFLKHHSYLLYIFAALFGLGDAAWNTFPNILLSLLFVNDPESAFANLKLWQSIGTVVPFIVGSFDVEITIQIGGVFMFLWLAGSSMVYLEILFSVFTLEKKDRTERVN